jgi:Asp-tRNA(Asn)/Glu-tRNA(Gln) amidotransferase A subunit family amidase
MDAYEGEHNSIRDLHDKPFTDSGRPLHGLPILVKGNIGTEDKMETAGKLACGTSQLITDEITSRLICACWR